MYHANSFEPPFLRWAGGKNWLLKDLYRFLPTDFDNYHEPFVGGGTIFFNLKLRSKSFLSDSNKDLIHTYCQIRNNSEKVISILKHFQNTKEHYYIIRDTKYSTPEEKAAQFIYLNRTCFNGLYRVNKNGEFNVPYGNKSYKTLFEYDKIRRFGELLKPTILTCCDFADSLKNISRGDLVFLDPPYTVTHIKNGFIKYNEKLFSWYDQERLAAFIRQIRHSGAFYILTNAKHDLTLPHFIGNY